MTDFWAVWNVWWVLWSMLLRFFKGLHRILLIMIHPINTLIKDTNANTQLHEARTSLQHESATQLPSSSAANQVVTVQYHDIRDPHHRYCKYCARKVYH